MALSMGRSFLRPAVTPTRLAYLACRYGHGSTYNAWLLEKEAEIAAMPKIYLVGARDTRVMYSPKYFFSPFLYNFGKYLGLHEDESRHILLAPDDECLVLFAEGGRDVDANGETVFRLGDITVPVTADAPEENVKNGLKTSCDVFTAANEVTTTLYMRTDVAEIGGTEKTQIIDVGESVNVVYVTRSKNALSTGMRILDTSVEQEVITKSERNPPILSQKEEFREQIMSDTFFKSERASGIHFVGSVWDPKDVPNEVPERKRYLYTDPGRRFMPHREENAPRNFEPTLGMWIFGVWTFFCFWAHKHGVYHFFPMTQRDKVWIIPTDPMYSGGHEHINEGH